MRGALIFSFINIVSGLSPLCPLPPYDDDVHLNCEFESGGPSDYATATSNLTIVEYNIDRNGYGQDGSAEGGLAPIIALLNNSELIPIFDVLVLSEVARGCEEYGGLEISGASVIAAAFGFNYIFAVEYVVISQSNDTDECSIGNAILSRYPIVNVAQLRFASQCCRYSDRYGGRIDIIGDISIDGKIAAHVHSCHLESGQANPKMVVESIVVREQQAGEMTFITFNDDTPIIIAGDLNSPAPKIDPTIIRLERDGFENSFVNKTLQERQLVQFDYIFSSPPSLDNAGYCTSPDCQGISDHVPYWAHMRLDSI